MAKDEDPEVATERAHEAELDGGRMPFLQHLVELRTRLTYAAMAFVVAFLVCWYYAKPIFNWLTKPLFDIWYQHCVSSGVATCMATNTCACVGHNLKPDDNWGLPKLIYTGLTDVFWTDMSLALWAGLFVASPIIFYQLWKFIAPGLYKRERRISIAFALFSAVFFVCGALFCFDFALPQLYAYMLSYNSATVVSLPHITQYLDLTRDSMLAFGAIFELPLFIYFLAMVGMVTHRSLWKFSRYWIVLSFVIGAILTPGPDVVSQFLMATPMVLLYQISILFAWRVTIRRERKAAAEAARVAGAD
ncbi:MAG TPA: twin-arginine translocase subunit TatC [Kofleriaceae bacterium]|jgi:sec-independent protein translocase protein TatC